MKIRKAIIPAAGLGTRFLPATKALPKEMLPILDKPAIQYIVEEAEASGIEEIMIISGRSKRAIEDHFDKAFELEAILEERGRFDLVHKIETIGAKANIHYIRQREPLGLGHAVLCARTFIGNEPFALMLGDDIVQATQPCLAQCMEQYKEHRTTIIGVQKVDEEEVHKYGVVSVPNKVVQLGQSVVIDGLVEKPKKEESPSQMAIMGRYIIEPDIFSILQNQQPSIRGEIELTDALNTYKHMRAFAFKGKRYDVGDLVGFLKANIELAWQDQRLRGAVRQILENMVVQEGGGL